MTGDDRREHLAAAGRWLREQRQRRRFSTAAEFARALGIDKTLVSNYETGRTAVPDDRADQIADVLRMDIITVRRNLGLWVPPDESAPDETLSPEGFDDPLDYAEARGRQIGRRLAEAERALRELEAVVEGRKRAQIENVRNMVPLIVENEPDDRK